MKSKIINRVRERQAMARHKRFPPSNEPMTIEKHLELDRFVGSTYVYRTVELKSKRWWQFWK